MKKTTIVLFALTLSLTAGTVVSYGASAESMESVVSQFLSVLNARDEEPDYVPPELYTAGDYQYYVNDDETTVTIAEYAGDEDIIEIPAELDGYEVSEIGYQAFTYKKMKSLILPDSIRRIGQRAFEYCAITDTLQLPANVAIADDAFAYAILPPVVVLPAGVTAAEGSFSYHEMAEQIFIGPGATIESRAFGYCDNLQQVVCATGSVLQTKAFEYCDALETAILCGAVEMQEEAFSYCDNVEVTEAAEEEFDALMQADPGSMQPGGTPTPDSEPGGTTDTVQPMSYLDYTDDILEDGSPIYYFPELSLKLPAEWQGKVLVQREDRGTAFYHKASYQRYKEEEGIEGGGFLFSLGASVNASFSRLPAFEYLGFSEESVMNYYLELPSDYPAYLNDAAVRAEYDAMYAQIDEVVSGASFYAGQNTADTSSVSSDTEPDSDQGEAGPPSGSDRQEEGITLEQVRYHFEHNAVPRYFYEDPANVLAALREQGMYMLWTALADENGVAYPYQADDFEEYWYELTDGSTILQIVMPDPEATPQCYRIYLLYNPTTGEAGYYTAEYDNFFDESAFLCGWDAQHSHMNYGGAAVTEKGSSDYEDILRAELEQVAQLAGLPAGQLPADPDFVR